MKQKQEKYSYSRLEVYVSCPFKYKLMYIDGYKPFMTSIATDIGTMIHACEESIAIAIKNKEPIPYNKLQEAILDKTAEIKLKYPKEFNMPDKTGKTYDKKIFQYLSTGIYRLENYMKANPSLEIVGAEIPFNFEFKKTYLFKGYIDRVFRDTLTNRYIIQDIKTWAAPKDAGELATPLQFVVYAMAARALWGVENIDISCEYDLPFCDLTQPAGTKGYLARGVTKLDKIFGGILDKEFKPKATPLCNYCAFCPTNPDAPTENKYMCPYFSHWTRINRSDFSKENEWRGLENHETILEAYHKQYGVK